jgi:hypothetical protein
LLGCAATARIEFAHGRETPVVFDGTHLAPQGIASLRMGLRGLGDSLRCDESPPACRAGAAALSSRRLFLLTTSVKSTKIDCMNCLDIRIALIISTIHRMVG